MEYSLGLPIIGMDWILLRLIALSLNVIKASARLPTSLATSKLSEALLVSVFVLIRFAKIKKRVKFFLWVSILLSKISSPNFFAACSFAIAAVSLSFFFATFLAE